MQQNFFMTMKGSSKGDVTSKANTSDSDETSPLEEPFIVMKKFCCMLVLHSNHDRQQVIVT